MTATCPFDEAVEEGITAVHLVVPELKDLLQ